MEIYRCKGCRLASPIDPNQVYEDAAGMMTIHIGDGALLRGCLKVTDHQREQNEVVPTDASCIYPDRYQSSSETQQIEEKQTT